jgi:L-amino acid N-acyltransferase YncA
MVVEGSLTRPAGIDDLDAIAEIYAPYVLNTVITFEENPPSADGWRSVRDDLAERGLPFLVAEVEGTVVGYAYSSPWRARSAYRHTVEDSVYLDPGWTGRGLGRLLLEALVADSARAHARQMVAVIADSGPDTTAASVGLHRACGFTAVGRLAAVGHKHGRWIDTLLMQRDLTSDQ